ncbi:replication-relaxation family protein [Bacillus amyloliquefaciens]|uniref:replication-relaxation family protein n=1 Tax=Bacillus amyloliquefaciens TaxID=1390 RepID=UPI002808E511|nr:replication-relaxation family protein [Bacillus amyloliquefaciens]MDQ8094891.1 replication-relaxation family protein [Bacillus amyloliquefaciens]
MNRTKYLVFTDQDKELLVKLHDFIYLKGDFIAEYIYTKRRSKQTVMDRLRELTEAGFITSFKVAIEGYNRPGNIYTLTSTGVQAVEQLQGFVKWNNRWSQVVPPWYQHQLRLNDIVMQYSEQLSKESDFEVKEWVPEARATWQYTDDKTDVLKPDGVLVLGLKGDREQNLALFVELERSFAKRKNTVNKVLRYNNFFRRGEETFKKYDLHVGFEEKIVEWRILFIGGNYSGTNKTIGDILSAGENIDIPIHVADAEDIQKNAGGPIYYNLLAEDPYQPTEL